MHKNHYKNRKEKIKKETKWNWIKKKYCADEITMDAHNHDEAQRKKNIFWIKARTGSKVLFTCSRWNEYFFVGLMNLPLAPFNSLKSKMHNFV